MTHPSAIPGLDILARLPVNLALLDRNFHLVWTNACWNSISHLPPVCDGNQTCFQQLERATPCTGCPVPKVLDTGSPAESELNLALPHLQGDHPWRIQALPLETETGFSGILILARDLLGRKTAEQALVQSEYRLKEAQKLARVGHWELTLPGQQLKWSDEIHRIFEIPKDQGPLSYEAFLRTAHPEDRQTIHQAYRKSVEKKEPYAIDHRLEFPDGRIKFVHEKGLTEYTKDGTPVRSMGTVQDITERKLAEMENKRLQEQVNQAVKMDSIGRMAGGIAHDFNNMLAVIFGQLDLAMDMEGLPSPLLENLSQIRDTAERSADLTRQLLAFARRQPVNPRSLDLNQTITRMLQMLTRIIGEDIDLEWRPDPGAHPIHMDPSQVDQILVNLCVNARDAIQGWGKITIETGNSYFNQAYCDTHPGFSPGHYVMLGVSDNGCGMTREIQSHLFEPFYSTKNNGKGTGLGLSTVYGIVRQNKGFIHVYSEPDKGSSFHIYFARYNGELESPQIKDTSTARPPGGNETILLVEDETLFLEIGEAMLTRLGYKVVTANTPSQALELARAHPTDLFIIDLVLPEMDGNRLAQALAEHHPTARFLFISGYTPNVIAHQNILNTDKAFLQKPFSREELAAKVREVLQADPLAPPHP